MECGKQGQDQFVKVLDDAFLGDVFGLDMAEPLAAVLPTKPVAAKKMAGKKPVLQKVSASKVVPGKLAAKKPAVKKVAAVKTAAKKAVVRKSATVVKPARKKMIEKKHGEPTTR